MHIRVQRGRRAHRKGLYAETVCVWYLRCKGYRILARRFKTPVGEIDIVARRGRLLIFVEVKARGGVEAAADAVTAKTMARMQRTVDYYISGRPESMPGTLRMDVMFVTPERPWPVHVCGEIGALRY